MICAAVLLALVVPLVVPLAARAADSTTHHTISIGGASLAFTAAVETIRLAAPDGTPAAEIVTTAFVRDKPEPRRPVLFAVNGGPGASSAWLDLGAIGPWRVPLARPMQPSQDPTPIDNADTWLPFADLVFIDPPGTGYSRAMGKGDPLRPFLTVDGDIRTLATVIHRWLAAHGRLAAPVFIAGESYGGFRAPKLARALLDQEGVGVRGLVLISPVLDFNGRDAPYDPMRWVGRLPSLVAVARDARSHAAVADAEAYAAGPFLTDLVRGPSDPAAVARITARVAALTGLDPALVRRRGGRIDLESMLRDRVPGRVASPYDGTLTAADPFPAAPRDNSPDPILDGLRAPLTAAMLMLYNGPLAWSPDGAPGRRYELLNDALARQWDYGHGNTRPEAMTALRQYLALDPAAHVLVVHGLSDLVTPYFATALLLDQVPPTQPPDRLQLLVLPGGHMPYLRDDSRAALTRAAAALVSAARAPQADAPAPAAPDTPPPAAPPAPPPATPPPTPGR